MNCMTLLGSAMRRACTLAFVVVLAATAALQPSAAFAQAGSTVGRAQQLYDAGKFADALTTVQNALASGAVTGSDAIGARALLARCQAKVGDLPAARKSFLQILHQDPQFRMDPVRTPPDEMEVFQQAMRVFQGEQEESARRLPASVSAFYGFGSGGNPDFGDYVALGGGKDRFDSKPMFGFGVRFPVAPRWSLDIELQRFRATDEDTITVPTGTVGGHGSYSLSATPLVVSVVYLAHERGKLRWSVFAGGGPMLNSYAEDKFVYFGFIPLKTTDSKVGTYFHGGLEAGYALHPKVSLTGRVLFRSAKATKMFEGSPFTQYSGGTIGDRDLDFSGFGASIGLRGYIGY